MIQPTRTHTHTYNTYLILTSVLFSWKLTHCTGFYFSSVKSRVFCSKHVICGQDAEREGVIFHFYFFLFSLLAHRTHFYSFATERKKNSWIGIGGEVEFFESSSKSKAHFFLFFPLPFVFHFHFRFLDLRYIGNWWDEMSESVELSQ